MVWINDIDRYFFETTMYNNYNTDFSFYNTSYDIKIAKQLYGRLNKSVFIMDEEVSAIFSLFVDNDITLYDCIYFTDVEDFVDNLNKLKLDNNKTIFLISTLYIRDNNEGFYVRCKIVKDYRECDSIAIKEYIKDIRLSKIKMLLSEISSKDTQ